LWEAAGSCGRVAVSRGRHKKKLIFSEATPRQGRGWQKSENVSDHRHPPLPEIFLFASRRPTASHVI
jgi:hypothetical protein